MRILNKLFTKNKLKNTIECVFKHSIACSAIKRHSFSQEILGEERIPPESHEEDNVLLNNNSTNYKICFTATNTDRDGWAF